MKNPSPWPDYNPWKNREYTFLNARKERRKILAQKALSQSDLAAMREILAESNSPADQVHFEVLKLVWHSGHFQTGHPLFIWGVTMDELHKFVARYAPLDCTSYEIHGHFQGFILTQMMRPRPKRDPIGRELAKAGGM